jgi:uncharacterized protein YecE (DUF72 family)
LRIRLGTQGWSYADWVGDMYDAAARPETYLAAYAQEFSTVEIDSTFYGTPSPERVRKWACGVPEGFRFSCKLAREITHERRLLESRGLIEEFYDSIRAFGAKLGCVLVQFDASFGRAEEPALRAALAAFPQDVRSAFEFRDPAWYEPDVQTLLEERGFALAVADAPFVPRDALAATLARSGADFAYLRLIGDHDAFVRFDREQRSRASDIAWWARALETLPRAPKSVYGYVNNHYGGHSPATVRALYAALGMSHVRPQRITQTSLFP